MKQKISWRVVFAVALFAPVAMALGQTVTGPASTGGASGPGSGDVSVSGNFPQGMTPEMIARYAEMRNQRTSGGYGQGPMRMIDDDDDNGFGISDAQLTRGFARALRTMSLSICSGLNSSNVNNGEQLADCGRAVHEEANDVYVNNDTARTLAMRMGNWLLFLRAGFNTRDRVTIIGAVLAGVIEARTAEQMVNAGVEEMQATTAAMLATSAADRAQRTADRARDEARIAGQRRTQDDGGNAGSRNFGDSRQGFLFPGGPPGFPGRGDGVRDGFSARGFGLSGQGRQGLGNSSFGHDQGNQGRGYGQQMSNQMSLEEMKRQFEEGQANVPVGQRMQWNDSMATRQGDFNSRSSDGGRSQGLEGWLFSSPTNPMTPEQQRAAWSTNLTNNTAPSGTSYSMTPEQQRAAEPSFNYQPSTPTAGGGALYNSTVTAPTTPPAGSVQPITAPTSGAAPTPAPGASVVDAFFKLWQFFTNPY